MSELTDLISQLVSINSINPDLLPGAPGEAEIARFAAGWLEQHGLEVHVDEPIPGRPNVVGIARGSGQGRSLMFNGHLDTVGVAGMPEPFQPRIQDGRLYGRGAYDMKGGLAACMLATARAKELSLKGDVIVAAVMDEEFAGLGTMDVAKRYRADAAIIAEATELDLVTAHKGFVWIEIETIGVAAHGSRPELGVDAIAKMGSVLVELERLDKGLRRHPTHSLLGSGSLHASMIQGGVEPSTYPERCRMSYERRTIPGETLEFVDAELQGIFDRLHTADPAFQAVVRNVLDRPPMQTPADAVILPAIQEAAARVLGHPAEQAGVPYWTDAATLSEAGIPSLLFGPAGAGAHAIEEWVDLASVEACAQVYLETAKNFCG